MKGLMARVTVLLPDVNFSRLFRLLFITYGFEINLDAL